MIILKPAMYQGKINLHLPLRLTVLCGALIAVLTCGSRNMAMAQHPFSQYFELAFSPQIDLSKNPSIDFSWNISPEAQKALNVGLTEIDEGNYAIALQHLNDVIRLQPSFWPSYYYRGVAYKMRGVYDSARMDFEYCSRISIPNIQSHLQLGQLYQMEKLYLNARDHYEKCLQLDNTNFEAQLQLGNIDLETGNERGAMKNYDKSIALDPNNPAPYVMKGILKLSARKHKEALAFLDRALQADSTYRQGLLCRGLYYMYEKKYDEALRDWDRLVQYDPENYMFILFRGLLNVELQRYDYAFNDLRKAVLFHEQNENSFRGQQTLQDKQIDVQLATRYAIRFSYGLNEQALTHFKKGFCLFLSQLYPKAIDEFKKAEMIEGSATVYYLTAVAYEHSGKHPEALDYYTKALRLDNDIFDAHKKRAIYRTELKDWAGANADYVDMLRLQPESKIVYKFRGLSKVGFGDLVGAVIDLSTYLKSDSTDVDVLINRAHCQEQLGALKLAAKDYREAVRYDSLNGALYEKAVTTFLAVNDTAAALQTLKSCIDMIPEDMGAKIWYAELAILRKNWPEVERILTTAMNAFHPDFYNKKLFAQVLHLRGLTCYSRKDYEMALNYLTRSIKEDPGLLEARYNLARTYIALGNKKAAAKELKVLKGGAFKDSKELYDSLSTNR
jgi:tetratricopeptide (TPR) repeat protein